MKNWKSLTVSAQGNRTHLTCVGDCERLEHTPWDTTQNLRNQKVHHRLRCEEDSREADDQEQARHNSVPVPNRLTNPSIEEQTNDLAHDDAVRQSSLPRRRDLPSAVRKLLAVLALELRESEEVVEQAHVVAFHDDTSADQDRPTNGLGVELDALPQGHLVLLLRRKTRIIDDLVRSTLVMLLIVLVQRLLMHRGGGLDVLLFRHSGSGLPLSQLNRVPGMVPISSGNQGVGNGGVVGPADLH